MVGVRLCAWRRTGRPCQQTGLRVDYQQLRARGKLGKVALIACMRKLLTIVNARRRDELAGAMGAPIAV